MVDGPGVPGARYRAFISYSHKDAGFGRRLHRRLEAYRLPRRLVGRQGPRGPVPARLAPIFRDREELAAAHDLTAEIRAALDASAALVVVCSPRAAASPWVAREIEVFRERHPDRPILAAVAEGEPAEGFPDVLRADAAEPLAADFRPGRDGPQLALLKLVAALAGVGLDELVQRDAQRRVRSVTAVTAGAVAATLAMSLLTAFALDARRQAERQRAEAEGLVEFMLTDLRTRLKGVGRLDIMGAVNQRALKYYGQQDLGRLPPGSLERRARLLQAIGEDDEERGDLDGALAQFQEASRTTSALLEISPADPQRIYAQAQSEYWVAFIDWRRGRVAPARTGFERYAALAHRLVAIQPSDPDWLMEVGYAESNLGTLALRDLGDPAEAERRFLVALAQFQAAVRARPADKEIKRELADAYAWVADSRRALGRPMQALQQRRKEEQLLLELLENDPRNAQLQSDLVGNRLATARLQMDLGRSREAVSLLDRALATALRLAQADPENARIRRQARIVRLFRMEAAMAAERTGSMRLAATDDPATCKPLAADPEAVAIQDFCLVLAARREALRGQPAKARELMARIGGAYAKSVNPTALSGWGISMVGEINRTNAAISEISR